MSAERILHWCKERSNTPDHPDLTGNSATLDHQKPTRGPLRALEWIEESMRGKVGIVVNQSGLAKSYSGLRGGEAQDGALSFLMCRGSPALRSQPSFSATSFSSGNAGWRSPDSHRCTVINGRPRNSASPRWLSPRCVCSDRSALANQARSLTAPTWHKGRLHDGSRPPTAPHLAAMALIRSHFSLVPQLLPEVIWRHPRSTGFFSDRPLEI
jgi:hypothetical protein